jgi:hypothetical protein
MLRQNPHRFAILLVLAGLALRALAPLGYMPSTFGSGYLFELCPDQLPAGFTFTRQDSQHHHHNMQDGASSTESADLCDFGHLLVSVAGVDAPAADIVEAAPAVAINFRPARNPNLLAVHAYRSRAPPA